MGTIEKEFTDGLDRVLGELRQMLVEKNISYGDSALHPVRIFSNAGPSEQLRVRIDDKLSRLLCGATSHEDTVLDLIGYLILLRIAERHERET